MDNVSIQGPRFKKKRKIAINIEKGGGEEKYFLSGKKKNPRPLKTCVKNDHILMQHKPKVYI